jgi:hypothetical protein
MLRPSLVGLCAVLIGASACTSHGFDSKKRDDGGGVGESGSPTPSEAGTGTARKDASPEGDTTPPRDAHVAPPPEGGQAKDGAAPPSSTDGATDAGIRDGSPDALFPDSGPASWCEGSMATFCADFDRARLVTDGWTSSDVTAGATLEFNSRTSTSPPRSLRSRIPAGTGANTAISVVRKSLFSTLGRTVLEFDCNVSSIATTTADWALQIARIGRNGMEDAAGIYAESKGTWAVIFGTGGLPIVYEVLAPPKYGRFVRISLDIVWSPTAGSVHLAFDGVSVLAKDGIVTAQMPATKTIQLAIGLADAGGSTPPSDVSYDNVTLEQH